MNKRVIKLMNLNIVQHTLNENDVEQQEQQSLMRKFGNDTTGTKNNNIDDNDGMDKIYFASFVFLFFLF